MTLTPRELRVGWTALALATAGALLFDGAGWRLIVAWLTLVVAGGVVLALPSGPTRAGGGG